MPITRSITQSIIVTANVKDSDYHGQFTLSDLETVRVGWSLDGFFVPASCIDVRIMVGRMQTRLPEPELRHTIFLPEVLLGMSQQREQIEFDFDDDESPIDSEADTVILSESEREDVEEENVHFRIRRPPPACTICYETKPNMVSSSCNDTMHSICSECLHLHATNWSNHSVSLTRQNVGCPCEGCDGTFSRDTVRSVLSEDEMTKLDDLILRFSSGGIVSCPNVIATKMLRFSRWGIHNSLLNFE